MAQNETITIHQEVEFRITQVENSQAGNDSCCIFKVPKTLAEINQGAYRPRIVSIGPYHNGNEDLKMIQDQKEVYLNDMMERTGKPFKFFVDIIVSLENNIRQSYSDPISTIDFTKMIALDGIFLIELFRKVGKLVTTHENDPIHRMVWVSPFLRRDLLCIENQIPFIVLQELFDKSKTNIDIHTLPYLILKFFNYAVDRPEKELHMYDNLKGKHLLDFFRNSFINNISTPTRVQNNKNLYPTSHTRIQPATKLVVSGIKLKAIHIPCSFLDIRFENGILQIPRIIIDDFYSLFFLNCVVFEQCSHHCSKHITTYVVFMGCFINNSADVGLLSECKIMENYFGTDEEVVKFFKKVGKDVAFDSTGNYLLDLFVEVNSYCKNGWHVAWAGFKHTYFEKRWSFISVLAATLLLSLTALQTFYTVYPYCHKTGKKV